jgi:TonB family protein
MRCKALAIGWIALLFFSGMAPICAQTQSPQDQDTDLGKKGTGDRVFRVGGGVSAPRAISAPDPEYSEKARNAKYQGTCVLRLVVDTKGLPRDIRVERPLGLGLDEKAVEAVRQWRFEPAMKDGVPVAVLLAVEVSFHFDGGSDSKFQRLFEKADAGDAKAQFEISQAFLSGRDLPKDESRGFAYLEKAAKQGLPKAQFAMGEYLSSHGNDLVTAYVWYALAQRHRYKHSDQRMKELAEKMTPEQLVEARRRVESTI